MVPRLRDMETRQEATEDAVRDLKDMLIVRQRHFDHCSWLHGRRGSRASLIIVGLAVDLEDRTVIVSIVHVFRWCQPVARFPWTSALLIVMDVPVRPVGFGDA